MAALQMALTNRAVSSGLVHHDHRGVQYASYIRPLQAQGIGMSRKGNP